MLSAFNGENPNGTWILNVSDNAVFDVGSVRAFSLNIAPSVVTCTAGCAPSLHSAGSTVVNESCPAPNGVIDPGEAATINLNISNTGNGTTTNLVATLQSSAHVLAPSGPKTYGAITPGATVGRDFTFTAAGNCGTTFPLTLQLQDGANDLGTLTFRATLGNQVTVGSAIVESYTGPPVPIPNFNASGVNIPLTVSGIPDRIGDANFSFDGSTCTSTVGATTVGLNYPWVGDLVVKLTSPAGTTITLMNRPGGELNNGDNLCHTVLDDSGVNAIQNISPAGNPWQGTFKPAEALSAFNGEDPNGTWILNVSDLVLFDAGSVRAFSLVITPATFACNAACAGITRIVASSVLSCDGGNTAAAITLSNTGTATANGVMLTTAKLGSVNGTPLPQGPFTLAPGASTTLNVTFSGAPSGSTTLQLGGTFSGGTYTTTRRLNAPNCSAATLFFPTTPSNSLAALAFPGLHDAESITRSDY